MSKNGKTSAAKIAAHLTDQLKKIRHWQKEVIRLRTVRANGMKERAAPISTTRESVSGLALEGPDEKTPEQSERNKHNEARLKQIKKLTEHLSGLEDERDKFAETMKGKINEAEERLRDAIESDQLNLFAGKTKPKPKDKRPAAKKAPKKTAKKKPKKAAKKKARKR